MTAAVKDVEVKKEKYLNINISHYFVFLGEIV
jgi:hypothetical protein